MARWSIRLRVLLALVIGVVIALVAITVFVERDFRDDAANASEGALAASRRSFQQLKLRDTAMLSAVLDTLMTRTDLKAALDSGDKARLETLSAPIFDDLNAQYGITHLYFISPEGRVILRAHQPGNAGDLVNRETFSVAMHTRGYGSGLELGKTAYALRVVHPAYASSGASAAPDPRAQGRLIGYLEVGEEIEHFLRLMSDQTTGDNYALLLPKSSLVASEWAAYRAGRGEPNDWSDDPTYVVAASTVPSLTQGISLPASARAVPEEGLQLGRKKIDGVENAVGAFPVLDAKGNRSGIVVAVHNLGATIKTAQRTQLGIGAAFMLGTVALVLAVVVMLNQLVFRRLKRLEEEAAESIGPDGEVELGELPEGETDEIGRFESALRRNMRELEVKSRLLDSVTDIVYVHGLDGRIIYANRAATDALGYSHDELLHMRIHDLVPESIRGIVTENIRSIVNDGRRKFESTDVTSDGRSLPVEVHSQTVEIDGSPYVVSAVRDLSERKKAEHTIEMLAYFDPLTGVANRRLFQDRLGVAMAQARRTGSPFAVVYVDVDKLKPINDSLGHAGGDAVLREIANRLGALVRDADTVARVGGDEFALLLLDSDDEGATLVGERLIGAMTVPIRVGEREVRVSVSAGVIVHREGDDDIDSVVRKADLAMYEAKELGANRFVFFDQAMLASASDRFDLESDLREAFDAGRLELHYQPQVRMLDGSVMGAEALCRWEHPTRGAVPPEIFIGMAEQSGLIVELGRWAIGEACRAVGSWHAQGLDGLKVAVNVSASQFADDDLVATVRRALSENNLSASALAIEITESVALTGSPAVYDTMQRLSALGVSLVIDDFGVGYSSLDRIADLPVQAIKVDRSFVARMTHTAERAAIVRTVVDLGHHLALETIAEGVETAEQRALLRRMGCEMAQGFLYARAMPSQAFSEFVRLRGTGVEIH